MTLEELEPNPYLKLFLSRKDAFGHLSAVLQKKRSKLKNNNASDLTIADMCSFHEVEHLRASCTKATWPRASPSLDATNEKG